MGITTSGIGFDTRYPSTASRHGYLGDTSGSGTASSGAGNTSTVPESPRQNSDFSTISNNVFIADDLFSILPRYNNGRKNEFGMSGSTSAGSSIFSKKTTVNGWVWELGASLMPLGVRYENRSEGTVDGTTELADRMTVTGFGGSLASKVMTPVYRSENGSSWYGQLLLDLNAHQVGKQTLLNLDMNTLGFYYDNVPFSSRIRTDMALKIYSKVNLMDNQSSVSQDPFSTMYGTQDLRKQRLQALWFQPSVNFKWDDAAKLIPNSMNLYAKINPADNWRTLYGATFTNKVGTCVSMELGRNKNEPNADMGLYLGQRYNVSKNLSLTVNLGTPVLFSTISDPNRKSIILGLGASYSFSVLGNKFKGNTSIIMNWDKDNRVRKLNSCNVYDNTVPFTGLAYEALQGPHQYTQDFSFDTDAIIMENGNELYLTLGTNNNGVDGVGFKDPAGNWINYSAKVKVESVTVYDDTLPPQSRLLAGAGQELVGRTLADISRSVPVRLPKNSNGTSKFRIRIKLSTNTGDFPAPPAVPECNISVRIRRE